MEPTNQRLLTFPILKQVFTACALVIQLWAFFVLFREIPALRNRETLWDMIGIVGYVQVFMLVESLLVTGLFVILALLLPGHLFRHKLVTYTTGIVIVSGIWAVALHISGQTPTNWSYLQLATWSGGYTLSIALVYFSLRRFSQFEPPIIWFVTQLEILVQVYVALGLLGWLFIIIRNI